MMQEIRLHGRGGQGAVTGAYILGKAAFGEGKFAQAFPSFGVERTGAPVMAFVRIDEKPIRLREHIYRPNFLIIQDASLVDLEEVWEGTDEETVAVLNAKEAPDVAIPFRGKLYCMDVTAKAIEVLGRPIFNTAMLGLLAGSAGVVKFESLVEAVRDILPPKLFEPNKKLLEEVYKAAPQMPVEYKKTKSKAKKQEKVVLTETVPGGTSAVNKTGSWGVKIARVDEEKCIGCSMCQQVCPENCVLKTADGKFQPDAEYCKGCGLCAKMCPVKAIQMQNKFDE